MHLYEQAHQEAPDDPIPLMRAGHTFLAMNRPQQAVRAFRRATQMKDVDRSVTTRALVKALLRAQHPKEAERAARKVLKDLPEDGTLITALGVTLDAQGQHRTAQQFHWQALDLMPKLVTARNNLAVSIALGGDADTATALLEELIDDGGDQPRVRLNLAMVHVFAGRTAAAARLVSGDFDAAWQRTLMNWFRKLAALPPGDRAEAVFRGIGK